MDEKHSWKEIYYEQFPHLKKDTSFSAGDIIRIFHNNLTLEEQEEVIEYFCQLCAEDLPPPGDPRVYDLPTSTPLLPPPATPLLPFIPIVPALRSPANLLGPQAIPPTHQITPAFLFIVIDALPHDLLQILKKYVGVSECEAANFELEQEVNILAQQVEELINLRISDNSLIRRYLAKIQALSSENDELIQRYNALVVSFQDYIAKTGGYIDEKPSRPPESGENGENEEPKIYPETEWWKEEDTTVDVTGGYITPNGYSHAEVINAIDYLAGYLQYFEYRGWFKSHDMIYYVFDDGVDTFDYSGDYVIEWAERYGY